MSDIALTSSHGHFVPYWSSRGPPVGRHEVRGGTTIHCTSTVGNLLIKDDKNAANGSIFCVAYTEDGAAPRTHPVTVPFGYYPASRVVYLNVGALQRFHNGYIHWDEDRQDRQDRQDREDRIDKGTRSSGPKARQITA